MKLKIINVKHIFLKIKLLGAIGKILLYGFFKIIPAGKHESGICGAPILYSFTSLKSIVNTCGQILFFAP
jgi:hypothetical protein